MTRFIMILEEAVCELFGDKEEDTKVIAIRYGEKMYETPLTNDECAKAWIWEISVVYLPTIVA